MKTKDINLWYRVTKDEIRKTFDKFNIAYICLFEMKPSYKYSETGKTYQFSDCKYPGANIINNDDVSNGDNDEDKAFD